MTVKLEWFKQKIKSFNWTWSDFFLAVGFLFMVPFAAFAWKFMVTANPYEILFKPWMIIVCFVGSISCLSTYLVMEYRVGRLKNDVFLWIFLLFEILAIVSILIQPSHFVIDVTVRNVSYITVEKYGWVKVGDIVQLTVDIPWVHKMFFCFGSLLINAVFFILFRVLPKRLRNLDLIIFSGICVFAFLVVLSVYSYIAEANMYGPYLKALLSGETDSIQEGSGLIKSFVTHRVPYGVCMMLGVMFALVLYGFTHKWYWIIPMCYCYINMIFSYCKTSLFLSALAVFVYFVYRLFATYKEHKKRNLVLLSIIGSVVGISLIVLIIAIASKGSVFYLVYKIFASFLKGNSMRARYFIWKNIDKELEGGWWIIGRGFGTHNFILYLMNLVNGDIVCPSHSSYYAVLGAGGVFNLIGFIGVFAYFGYCFYHCFKVQKDTTIGLSMGFLAFFFYTFTEGVNYLILVFAIPIIWYYNLIKNGNVTKDKDVKVD